MKAIVYTTNTGSAEKYAQLLAQATGLPVYSFGDAKKYVPDGAEIIYVGWIMASKVKGYRAAAKRFDVRAVCAVGMAETGSQSELIRSKNAVPSDTSVFDLQGNFDVRKLRGIYRAIMEPMIKTLGKRLAEKNDRTQEENDMLEMLLHGGERVSEENLGAVIDWYRTQI